MLERLKLAKLYLLFGGFFWVCLETFKKILVTITQGFKLPRHNLFSKAVRIDNIIKTRHCNQEVEHQRLKRI
jgi:hypothetical protein